MTNQTRAILAVLAILAAWLLGTLLASSQAPPAPPKTGPSEIAQWRAYATQLEGDVRDKGRAWATCAATAEALRVELETARKRITELETPK